NIGRNLAVLERRPKLLAMLPNVCRSRVIAVAIGFAVAAGTTACETSTSRAPPIVECGTTLSDSISGAVVFDATHKLPVSNFQSRDALIFLRVARGCDHGSHVRWVPSTAARRVGVAYAGDGLPAVVVLEPCGKARHSG